MVNNFNLLLETKIGQIAEDFVDITLEEDLLDSTLEEVVLHKLTKPNKKTRVGKNDVWEDEKCLRNLSHFTTSWKTKFDFGVIT